MAVDDQAGPAGVGEGVDHREAVWMAGWRFMGHQDVEAESGQAIEVFGENRVAMEQRQAAAPSLAGSQGRLEFGDGCGRMGWSGRRGPRPSA